MICLQKNITKSLIFLFCTLFLISCQGIEKPYQTARTSGSEKDVYQQAIYKASKWINNHPPTFEDEGALVILEEIMAFYVLWKNTDNASQKKKYYNEVQKRINLIALKKDFNAQPKEHTLFLTVTMITEKLQIHTNFRKIIEEQILTSPFLFTQHITNTIWVTVYLNRLGYHPLMELDSLMPQSNLYQELHHRLVYQYVCSPVNPIYKDTTTLTLYHMTHEIFSLTDLGELPSPPIIENNKAFFSELFEKSIQWTMAINHIDLLGELIMCVKILDLRDVPSLQQGIEYILSSQEDNGTFGITNPTLPNIYRHGILVSMMTLSMV
ncbi:MAG: DUF6895 family protein [bacterium]